MAATRNRWILPAYFVLGAYAVCAQATLLREVQVLVFGSELSWGLVLGFWLAGVAVGASMGGRLARSFAGALGALTVAGLAMPLALAGTVVGLRVARGLVGVGTGEYVGPGTTALLALVGTVPVSVWVGLAFPAASVLVARGQEASAERARAVGRVYLAESLGALVGGTAFSFLLVGRVGALPLALAGGAVLALAMDGLVRSEVATGRWRFVPVSMAVVLASVVALGPADRLERETVRQRWRTFAGRQELVASADTPYQNVAIGRIEDQFSVYTNGLVAATWPNHADLAVEAHLAACEHPAPKRMLVLGGGAEGLLGELLRHGPERLDVVTLDQRLLDMMRAFLDPADRQALDAVEARGWLHIEDARRFVKRAAARGERYDLVLLAAPEPSSTLEARLYTHEFFAELAGAMADDGVLVFALGTPIGYWSEEAAVYANSILRPLEAVFPETLLTFSSPMICFAARLRGVLTDSGEVLAARYTDRGIASPYFDPLLFQGGLDLLDAEKRRETRRALAAHPPPFVNTDARPVAAFHHVRYWLAQSAAAHAGPEAPAEHRADVLGAIAHLRLEWAMLAAVAATAVAAAVGRLRGRAALRRTAVLWSVGTTGFASMALEVVLLYTFQTLYGYVYSMVGAVIGVFMFGLVAGSLAMNQWLRRAHRAGLPGPGLPTVVALDLAMAVFAAGLVIAVALLRQWSADVPVQIVTFALVAVSGVLGGLVFPLAAAVTLREARSTTGRTAGAVDAADHFGACVGAFVTGAALVPILGTTGACLTVVGLKALSALVAGLAARTERRPEPVPTSVPRAPSA
ncbi:MAG: fused MFS/spermidine synthase [Planctomycetes bacterium]|nr:fused MFS/spermidine synthase [Planctomycetota bacterium]